MRMVGELADEGAARRLVDYLLTIEIPAEARTRPDGWGVWIVNEDQFDRGVQEFLAYQSDPHHAKYASASASAKQLRRAAESIERTHRKNSIDLSDRLGGADISRVPVTLTLIAISLFFALASNVGERTHALQPFYFAPPMLVRAADGTLHTRSAGLDPIRRGEIWRLWTSMFIHYGWIHLVFNMFWLARFGTMLELRKNSWVLLALVLVSEPTSALAEYIWNTQSPSPRVIALPAGMSGVVYALFGYIWMKSDYDPESGLRVSTQTVMFMFLWIVACMTGALGNIANAAHMAGLIFGMCVGLFPHVWTTRRTPD